MSPRLLRKRNDNLLRADWRRHPIDNYTSEPPSADVQAESRNDTTETPRPLSPLLPPVPMLRTQTRAASVLTRSPDTDHKQEEDSDSQYSSDENEPEDSPNFWSLEPTGPKNAEGGYHEPQSPNEAGSYEETAATSSIHDGSGGEGGFGVASGHLASRAQSNTLPHSREPTQVTSRRGSTNSDMKQTISRVSTKVKSGVGSLASSASPILNQAKSKFDLRGRQGSMQGTGSTSSASQKHPDQSFRLAPPSVSDADTARSALPARPSVRTESVPTSFMDFRKSDDWGSFPRDVADAGRNALLRMKKSTGNLKSRGSKRKDA